MDVHEEILALRRRVSRSYRPLPSGSAETSPANNTAIWMPQNTA